MAVFFPSLFGAVELPDPAPDYRNPVRPRPIVRRPAPRPTR